MTSQPTEGPAAAGKLLLPSLVICCGLWAITFLMKVLSCTAQEVQLLFCTAEEVELLCEYHSSLLASGVNMRPS